MPIPGLGNWTASYQAAPVNTDSAGQADDQILQLKKEVRLRAKYDHDWGDAGIEGGYTDTGRHTPGSARAYFQDGAPTGLRVPDNTGYQTATTLTGAADQGRLWVETDNGNRLYVYNATGSWEPVMAVPALPAAVSRTSLDATAIPNGSVISVGSWSGTLSIVLPDTGTFRLMLFATIWIRNNTGVDRYAWVELEQTAPSAFNLVQKEVLVPARIDGTYNGLVPVEFFYTVNISATGQTYTFDFKAEGNSAAAGFTLGGGACALTTEGGNVRHRCDLILLPSAAP